MYDPFKINGPALISFSGGRTSAYLLYRIVEAYQGDLPDDIFVTFANTGKEAEQTLEFVDKCSKEWGVHVHWLEHYFGSERPKHRTKEVTFETASRNGEPFERLIDDRGYLPNPVGRYCSSELKIKVMRRFMQSKGYKEWYVILGLRYDEPHRAVRARNNRYDKFINVVPLYDAKITNEDVLKFWSENSFDLGLRSIGGKTLGGNCDLCFLKAKATKVKILKEEPERAEWWLKQERKFPNTGKGQFFRRDISMIDLVDISESPTQQDLIFDDEQTNCFCHD